MYYSYSYNKSAKFETLKCFCFMFRCFVKVFSSKHIVLKVDVTGAKNILFACASVHLSARKIDRLWQ